MKRITVSSTASGSCSGGGNVSKMGENLTGTLSAGTLYRIKFTEIDHATNMTYTNAYSLTAIDPNTGETIACDLLGEGETFAGGYTRLNSFRLRVLVDLAAGLKIIHNGY